MQHRMIDKYISRPLRWLLQNNVSYWHQGLHAFRSSNGNYQLALDKAEQPGRIIIISRLHYQEFVQHYPVAGLSELKQVLKTEFQHRNNVIHYIAPLDGQRRAVCSIVIADDIVSQFKHNCILIPETLLLWQAIKADKSVTQPRVYQATAFTGYFLYCADTVPVSQRINSFCADFPAFVLNNGISDLARCEIVPDNQYANRLVKALATTLPMLPRLALLRRPSLSAVKLPLKAMAFTAGAIVLVYMLLVAGYYQYSLQQRQADIAELGSEINQLLDTQQQLQNTQTQADKLLQQQAGKNYSAHLWQVLIPLLENDSSLSLQNIATENSRIILRGQASKATAVLTELQASELVSDARFDTSVRRQRDKDIFVISMLMTQQAVPTTSAAAAQRSGNSDTVKKQPEAADAAQ